MPFVRAHWLLAELEATRLRLAALEVEIQELRTSRVVVRSDAAPSDDRDLSSRWPEWLTVAAFAEAIGISRGLTDELIRRGELTRVRRFGRLMRIHRDALRGADERAR